MRAPGFSISRVLLVGRWFIVRPVKIMETHGDKSGVCVFLKHHAALKLESLVRCTRVSDVHCLFVLEQCWKLQGNAFLLFSTMTIGAIL